MGPLIGPKGDAQLKKIMNFHEIWWKNEPIFHGVSWIFVKVHEHSWKWLMLNWHKGLTWGSFMKIPHSDWRCMNVSLQLRQRFSFDFFSSATHYLLWPPLSPYLAVFWDNLPPPPNTHTMTSGSPLRFLTLAGRIMSMLLQGFDHWANCYEEWGRLLFSFRCGLP